MEYGTPSSGVERTSASKFHYFRHREVAPEGLSASTVLLYHTGTGEGVDTDGATFWEMLHTEDHHTGKSRLSKL
jgi:hypothetical protein